MKNFIYSICMFICFFVSLNSNAQIKTVVQQKDLFTVIDKWNEPGSMGMNPLCNLIKINDGSYELRFYSQNQFEDTYVMLRLGKDKNESISTLKTIIDLFGKVTKDNPITIQDVDNNEITIYKHMGFYYFDQPGVAISTRTKHATNAITVGIMNKIIKAIEKNK